MSKLIERLEKVDAASIPPLGFGASRAQAKPASMLLVARSAGLSAPPTQLQADFYMATVGTLAEAELEAVKDCAGDIPWGIWPISPSVSDSLNQRTPKEPIGELKEQGADFLVVNEGFQAGTLADEQLGRLLILQSEVSETLARSLEELPVDAIVLDCGDSFSLYVRDLVEVSSVRALTSKPLLVMTELPLSKEEIALLQEIGVQGLVISFEELSAEEAAQIREAIDALPPRKAKRDQPAPVLPRAASREAAHQHDEEPDDRRV